MKNKLLLLAFCLFAIIGCKKDKNNEPGPATAVTVKQRLVGNWQLVKAMGYQYDASGKVVNSEEETVNGVSTWAFLENNTVNNDNAGNPRTYQYILTDTNGKVFLDLTSSFTERYEVLITNGQMTWTIEEETTSGGEYKKTRLVYYFNRK